MESRARRAAEKCYVRFRFHFEQQTFRTRVKNRAAAPFDCQLSEWKLEASLHGDSAAIHRSLHGQYLALDLFATHSKNVKSAAFMDCGKDVHYWTPLPQSAFVPRHCPQQRPRCRPLVRERTTALPTTSPSNKAAAPPRRRDQARQTKCALLTSCQLRFHGTCTELTRSLYMDERHHQARKVHLDDRDERTRRRNNLLHAVSCRMQSFFITLRWSHSEDANTTLMRAEQAHGGRQ